MNVHSYASASCAHLFRGIFLLSWVLALFEVGLVNRKAINSSSHHRAFKWSARDAACYQYCDTPLFLSIT